MTDQLERYEHILQAVFGEPWAITQEYMDIICGIVQRRIAGINLTAEEIKAEIGAAERRPVSRNGAVAVLPLYGPIAQRMNLMTQTSGGTSTQQFEGMFLHAMADPNVSSVVIDIDSPGGSVFGIQEAWNTIMSHRGEKPVTAVANSLAASAAYWIATAADSISVTPSGSVGSIGVIAEHQDLSAAMEMEGVRTTIISAGKKKAAGNPYEPLGEQALADMQAKVDNYYGMFVESVARGRNTTATAVRNGFGEGDMVMAREALQMGMVDRIETLGQAINRMAGTASRAPQGSRADLIEGPLEPVEPESIEVKNDALDVLRDRRLKMLG